MEFRICGLTGNVIGETKDLGRIVYAPKKCGGFRLVDTNIKGRQLGLSALELSRWYRRNGPRHVSY